MKTILPVNDRVSLAILLDSVEPHKEFGASFVQRLLGVGFPETMRAIDLGVREGLIRMGSEEYKYKVVG